MDITKKFKDNLGVIIALCTILGVVVSVFNGFILLNIAPLKREVVANGEQIEDFKKTYMPLDLSQEKWKNNDRIQAEIKLKLDNMENKIDRLLYK